MLSNYVTPGDRVEMTPVHAKQNADEPRKVYKSQVVDLLSEERMELTMPMEKSKLILLPIGGEYTVHFYTSNGVYQCSARVAERYKRGNIFLLALELTGNLSKRQRREFFRYDCAIGMLFRRLEPQEDAAAKKNKKQLDAELPMAKAVIVDISGGGLRYVSDTAYEAESLLYLRFILAGSQGAKEYNLVGRLLTIREMENKKGYYQGHVQYVVMDNKEREEIIKFIFEEERKRRKREKGE